ncbi:MAG: MBL fold metallo-hydrolase [Muribaculaceae bacterium]|nr:MBL fold metallo-hydrolase [Muribaculaceae bacterium]
MARNRNTSSENEKLPSLFDNELPIYEPIRRHAEAMIKLRENTDNDDTTDSGSSLADDPVMLHNDATDDRIYFISFGSGSSGNCSYIGDRKTGFLIDAGIDGKQVTDELKRHGIEMTAVKGICLTHDHGDHVRYAYSILRNNRHIGLYCTPRTLNGLLRRHSISRRIKDYHKAIYKEFTFEIGAFRITAFDVMHDGTDNAGFFIEHGSLRMAVATDLGCISPRVDHYMRQSNFIVIESNYDLPMLMAGTYPDYLKARIVATNGHLDNDDAARYISSIYSKELRYVFLCHLSHDNNTPDKAIAAHTKALEPHNIAIGDGTRELTTDLQLIALPRYEATAMYVLRMPPQPVVVQ